MRTLRLALSCCCALLLAAGCASTQHAPVNFTQDARSNLDKGKEALEGKEFEEAQTYFEEVRTKYPFLEEAKEAELLMADLDYARERYAEARDRYQAFVKAHPSHPSVDYAAFRAATTHLKDMPTEIFFLPPASEKDQVEVKGAYEALRDFLKEYPGSKYEGEARKLFDDVRRRLVDHELYVARFYAKRDRWAGTARRLEGLLEAYPGSSKEEEAFFLLHEAYEKLHDTARAQETLRRVQSRMPGTPAAERARKLLGA
ncbi:outer membrane protein assembly factor BamD [Aggregicoccus sp. 17bor-14]|uniref:outer membrane protein assembly factor BamD n=1 Tax=Myxococcaceae TaxID=31 RepID=UPI00129C7352|nr:MULTISPECIES: outer membrane protein assembly factor BamD [Myxococcaceae]MBF5042797.1 outer membrane protein assembly factor BamD [Simulacricoccus sp. 17bor-14]MRI88565.1 outer membrane protein assembly factor BamD [Aggregicoccus sp. 17bor-14]